MHVSGFGSRAHITRISDNVMAVWYNAAGFHKDCPQHQTV